MARRTRTDAVVFAALLGACATPAPPTRAVTPEVREVRPASPAAAISPPTAEPASVSPGGPGEDDRITLSRTACAGACPVYSLTVFRSGRVAFQGVADTFLVGEKAWRLDAMFVKHLFSEFDKAQLPSLPARVPTEVEEFPGLTLEYRRGGLTTRRQLGGEGTGELPRDLATEERLKRLATLVDKLTASGRYVETSSKRRAGGCVE